jgi:hypothetical protein
MIALLFLPRENIQKPPLVASIGTWPSSLQRKNTRTSLDVGVLVRIVRVVVPATGCPVENLHDHLAIAFLEEGEQAAGLKIEVMGELIPPGVQVHLALSWNKISTCHRQKLQLASRIYNSASSTPSTNSANLSESHLMPRGS